MKNFSLFIVFLFLGSVLCAQDEDVKYLLKKKKFDVSVFASPGGQVGMINGEAAFSIGFGGAIMFNRKFFFGGYGENTITKHGFGNIYETNQTLSGVTTTDVRNGQKIDLNYGGLWLGYVFMPKNAIHFGVSSKVGIGTLSVSPGYGWSNDVYDDWYPYSDLVGVVLPQIELGMNLLRWVKVSVGIGYRYVFDISDKKYDATNDGIDNPETRFFEDNALNSPYGSVNFIFMFGKSNSPSKQKDR